MYDDDNNNMINNKLKLIIVILFNKTGASPKIKWVCLLNKKINDLY